MTPIPQSPWTLAIAELVGMRLATAGSSAHPADLLANLLPSGDPLPEGWFDQFLAGTPIPGWTPAAAGASPANPFGAEAQDVPANSPGASVPSAPAPGQAGAALPPNTPALLLQADNKAIDPEIARLWQQAMKCLTIKGRAPVAIPGLAPDDPAIAAFATVANQDASHGQTALPDMSAMASSGGFPPLTSVIRPPSAGNDSRLASSPPAAPGVAASGSSSMPSPGRQIGQDRRVEVNLTVDTQSFGRDIWKIAERVAEQTFSRRQSGYAAQLKGSGWNR